ncbi:hypothetical protein PACG_05554 [Pseudomonas aeruginosa C3719]|uniref:Uncharacterized protein n=1 Tax=Pseudomonas aeruginosa TaxID=287 RepID=Q58CH7_PSEAI|nr:hypothetical protein PACG_05554 [Pseudomonas aeruginosa C3719]CAH61037.1 unnamed protein product [Pseudomonas aeruginosa]
MLPPPYRSREAHSSSVVLLLQQLLHHQGDVDHAVTAQANRRQIAFVDPAANASWSSPIWIQIANSRHGIRGGQFTNCSGLSPSTSMHYSFLSELHG